MKPSEAEFHNTSFHPVATMNFFFVMNGWVHSTEPFSAGTKYGELSKRPRT
jgi:hypothetical protein